MSDNVIPFTGPEIEIDLDLEDTFMTHNIMPNLQRVYPNAIVMVEGPEGELQIHRTDDVSNELLIEILWEALEHCQKYIGKPK